MGSEGEEEMFGGQEAGLASMIGEFVAFETAELDEAFASSTSLKNDPSRIGLLRPQTTASHHRSHL